MTDIKERLQDSGGIEWPHGAFCPVCDKLKLDVPGMAEIFEQRGVDLETPNVSCECAKLLVKRAEWANLPAGFEERTFANFVQREGTGEAYRAAASFADWKSPCMLTLVGGTGTGKTYLLQAIANALMERGTSVRYEYAPELASKLHLALDDQSQSVETILEVYRRVPVLLLDDLGAEKTSDWAMGQMAGAIDFRIRHLGWTAVTTNLTYDQMKRAAFRLASRLWAVGDGSARVATLTCKTDYRTGQAL